jgi:hypothetical protein
MSPLLDPANGKVGANVNRHEDDVGRLARNWKFESIPLPRRVRKPSVPLDVVAASTSSATSSTEPPQHPVPVGDSRIANLYRDL